MQQNFDRFMRDNQKMTSGGLAILSLVSGYFTYQGAALVLEQPDMFINMPALIFSVGVSAALFLFWRYALNIVPRLNTKRTRLMGVGIITVGAAFIICLSSWMNVMALAGTGAYEAQMRDGLVEQQAALQESFDAAQTVKQMVPDLQLVARRYAELARSEIQSGALTGRPGAGGVADSLVSTQRAISSLVQTIDQGTAQSEKRYREALAVIVKMDEVLAGDNDVEERLATFANLSAEVGHVISDLRNDALTKVIARTMRGLAGSTGLHSVSLRNASVASAQSDALRRIAQDLGQTGERIASAAESLSSKDKVEPPVFERISVATAVFTQAASLIPYWAGGIALDLLPVLLILFLMLFFYATEGEGQHDDDIDRMSFGEVRKVLMTLEAIRPQAATAPALPAPANDQPTSGSGSGSPLSEAEEDEWQRHLNGGKA